MPKPREYRNLAGRRLATSADGRHSFVPARRPRPVLDKLAAASLILLWLLCASADTYGPLWLFPILWAGQGWWLTWVYRQYREHTAPSMLDKSQPAIRLTIPLPVRLMLLPGAHWIVGTSNVHKARRIRFMRTDLHRRALGAREADHRQTFSRATGTIPTGHTVPPAPPPGPAAPASLGWQDRPWPGPVGTAFSFLIGDDGQDRLNAWAYANEGCLPPMVHLFWTPQPQQRCRCGEWSWGALPRGHWRDPESRSGPKTVHRISQWTAERAASALPEWDCEASGHIVALQHTHCAMCHTKVH